MAEEDQTTSIVKISSAADLNEAIAAGKRNFYRASLVHADLDDAQLAGVLLSRAILKHARLRRSTLDRSELGGLSAADADFSAASLRRCCCKFAGFQRTTLDDTVFDDSDLEKADLSHASLSRACFRRAQLRSAKFVSARGTEIDFTGATVDDADLSEGAFPNSLFDTAILRNANLRGAVLPDIRVAADVTGAIVDSLTYGRSRWTPKELADLERRGARIEDLQKFPRDARDAVLNEEPPAAGAPGRNALQPEASIEVRSLAEMETQDKEKAVDEDEDRSGPSNESKNERGVPDSLNAAGGASLQASTQIESRAEETTRHGPRVSFTYEGSKKESRVEEVGTQRQIHIGVWITLSVVGLAGLLTLVNRRFPRDDSKTNEIRPEGQDKSRSIDVYGDRGIAEHLHARNLKAAMRKVMEIDMESLGDYDPAVALDAAALLAALDSAIVEYDTWTPVSRKKVPMDTLIAARGAAEAVQAEWSYEFAPVDGDLSVTTRMRATVTSLKENVGKLYGVLAELNDPL